MEKPKKSFLVTVAVGLLSLFPLPDASDETSTDVRTL
jgi:hypothetical protein